MGKILIFSGPSGVGKGTIIEYLRNKNSELFTDIITGTSRKPRENNGELEVDGVDYHFFTPDEFRDKIREGYFAEYEEVYPDKFYGTPLQSLEKFFESKFLGTMDIDYKGALNLKQLYPNDIITVFIKSKDFDQLRHRIQARNPKIEDHDIDFRLLRAKEEFEQAYKFDHIITNDEWDHTILELTNLINKINNINYEGTIN